MSSQENSSDREAGEDIVLLCETCGDCFTDPTLLSKHLLEMHNDILKDKNVTCPTCQKTFKTEASLRRHKGIHKNPLKCDKCPLVFSSQGELIRHSSYVHEFKKPFKCPHCHYSCVERQKLVEHMRCHTGECPYVCGLCPKKFKTAVTLTRHMLVHTGDRRFICIKCFSRFGQSGSLKIHLMSTHKIDKKYIKSVQLVTLQDLSESMEFFLRENGLLTNDNTFTVPLKHYRVTQRGWGPNTQRESKQGSSQEQMMPQVVDLKNSPNLKGQESVSLTSPSSKKSLTVLLEGNECCSIEDICVPLTEDPVLANQRLREMKNGQYGISPHVVMVRPDGMIEDVTSEYKDHLPV